MVNISNITEKIIKEKPFLQEALSKGIINNAALAEELLPKIETQLGKKVKFSSVNMAIRRLSEKLNKTFISEVKFDKDCDITIKTDLFEITIYSSGDVQKFIEKTYSVIDFKKGDFLTITQGLNEIMIISNKKNKEKITKIFPKNNIKKIINNLSSVTISLPENAVQTVGFFYVVTKSLNWENIPIIDIVSTYTEMTFILNEKDTSRSLDILKEVIKKN